MGTRAAQAFKFLLLQYAQKFGLQRQGNIADLIQEKRAFVCHLETADLLRDGACESALLMAKKFAFQQIERNRSAIQFYVGAPAARADIVNRARDEFLARAGFTLEKNGGIGWCDSFDLSEDGFQRRAIAYQLLESALIMALATGLESCVSSHSTS